VDLLSLTCPACGAALPTAAGRRIFVCDACHRTSTVPVDAQATGRAPSMVEVPRVIARPRLPLPDVGRLVLLPVWFIPVRRGDLGPRGGLLPAQARVPAVGLERMETLLRFATHLTRATGECTLLDAAGALACEIVWSAAELSCQEAMTVAEPVLLAHAEWGLGDDATAEVPLGPPRLVDLPCQQVGGRLTDLVFGRWSADALLGGCVLPDQRRALSQVLVPLAR
jgi:hypothetical protein